MIKRNKKILCFLIVMFITLMTCCAVSATDNTDKNTTNTQNNEITAQAVEVINEKNVNTINTNNAMAQSEENTIEETDNQNAVKNEENKTKAKTINKVSDNTQNVKTATELSGKGTFILDEDINLTGRLVINGNFILDGQGHTISGAKFTSNVAGIYANGTAYTIGNITIQNVVFKDFPATALSFADCSFINVKNCTFINCAINSNSNGVVYLYRSTTAVLENLNIFGNYPHAIRSTGYSTSIRPLVSFCEINYNGNTLTDKDLGSGTNSLLYTTQYAESVLLILNHDDITLNEINNFQINFIKQASGNSTGVQKLNGSVSYTVTGPDGIIIPIKNTNTQNGIRNFTSGIDKKGIYTINYSYTGGLSYYPISGSKIIIINETSSLSDVSLSSVKNDIIKLYVTLKNSTNSTINNAQVSINIRGHLFYGTTNDEGIATIEIPYNTYKGSTYQTTINYEGDEEHFIAPSQTTYTLDLINPPIKDTYVIPVSPVEGYAGNTVTLSARVTDEDDTSITEGSVIFSVDGTELTGLVFENGVAKCSYTITTSDSVNVLVTYSGVKDEYKSSTGTIVVNRLTIPTNLTISDIPENLQVGDEFNFNVKLTNRTGEAITGEEVKVYVNDVEIEELQNTDTEGIIKVPYTPKNNSELNIKAEYTTTNDIYLANTTDIVTIPSSSISLISTEIGADYSGNASIGHDYIIKVNLTANGELIDAKNISVSVNTLESIEHHSYDSETKILTITLTPTEVTVYNVNLVYDGLTGVYAGASESFTVIVDKIKTSTFVDYDEYDAENVTLRIYFLDENGNKIYEHATFHVNMNNSDDERQDFDMDNLDDPSYKWNITYKWNETKEDGYFLVHVDPKFYRENGTAYAYITFNGTDIYEKSTDYKSEMEVKEEVIIELNTYEDDNHTIRKNVFYINETVNIYLDIINKYGSKQNGGINVSIANNKFPENAFDINDQTSSNVYGFKYVYHNGTSGEYTITVKYKGSGAYNPTSITRTFTLIKLDSSTTARIINNTAGNVTIGVKVKDNLGLPIKKGNLTVEVNGVPRVVPFDIEDDEVIVNLNSIGLGITTTSEIPITITYQGSDVFSSSEAVDEETGNSLSSIVADKGVNNITVTVSPEDVTIGNMFDVSGYIRELDGTPVSTSNLNITIINPDGSVKSSNNVTTNGNGYFINSYTATLSDYPAGEYTVNISYYDKDHNLTTVQKPFTVSKVSTNVAATVENRTNGNITVKVKVTDNRGNPVTEGKVNITDSTGEILYKDVEVNANGEAVLVVDSITQKGTNSFVVNYDGNEKYADSTTTDGLTNVEVLLRDLTIDAAPVNSTYGNVSFKVNITDTTTHQGLVKEFKVLDKNDNVLGTYTTGEDGTIVIDDIDLPIGSQTLYINYTDSVSYTSNKVPVTINVQPRESKVNATVIDTKAEEVTVRVNAADATTGDPITSGTIVITDNDEVIASYSFEDVADGIVDVPTEIIDSGSHDLVVILHSTNYADSSYTDSELANVNVDKRDVAVAVEPVNSTIGNTTVKVTVTDEDGTTKIVNGTVNVYSDEEKTNLIGTAYTDENGVAIVNVTTAADTNPVFVEYAGNTTYNANTVTQSLALEKRLSNVNASLVDGTAGDVTVRVNVTDATTGEPISEGTIIIKDGDEIVAEYPITENPGFIDVKTDITESGEHSLTVEYKGTSVYEDSEFDDTEGALTNINIAKRNATVLYEVVDSTYQDTIIKVTIVDEDGSTPIVGGQVIIQLPESTEIIGQNTTDNDGVTYIKVNAPVTTTSLTVNYAGNITYNENVTTQDIQITPRAINVNATVTNTTAGNVTVKVNITDALTQENVRTGKVNIISNGEVVAEIDLETATFEDDGTILIYTNVNQTGKYRFTTEYDGRPEYGEEFYNLEAFTVTPKESELTATVPNTVKGNTTVNITFTDPVTGDDLNGTVYVSVNGGKLVPVQVVDGKGGIPADLPIGDNNIKVVFDGDEKYDENSYEFDVHVSPRDIIIDYEITNNTQGNVTIKVTVDDAETGEGVNTTVIVYVDDKPVEVEIVGGVGTAVLDIPVTGGKISVYHEEDDTYSEVPTSEPEQVEVVKRESSITAEPVGNSANDTSVKVTLRDPVTDKPIISGTIVITDNGVEVARIEFSEETGEVIVPTNIITSGKHNLNVTFEGNENYTSSNYTDDTLSDILIANRTANITVTPNNTTYGNTSIDVSVVDSETGDALPSGGIVKVYDEDDNEVGEGTLKEDGTVTIPIDVPIDTTKVIVKYLGNSTSYNPAEAPYDDLSLDPRASKIEAEVTNTTAGNITVKVNVTDATTGDKLETGKITITDNTGEPVAIIDLENDEYTVDEDGFIVIYTNIEETGRYKLSVTYENAPEYDESSVNTEAFTVTPKESQLTVDVPNKVKSNTTVNVTLTDPVTGENLNGNVSVYIDGVKQNKTLEIIDGKGGDLFNIPVGEHTVKVVFDGDEKYSTTSEETIITVEPRKINVEATLTNTTQGNITLEVTVTDDETGAGVNGTVLVTLPNGTDVEVEVVDGKGVAILDIPISDSTGEPLTVKYPADGENEEKTVNTDNALDIAPRSSKVEAEVTNPVADKTELTVTVTDPVTGNPVTSGEVSVKLGDNEIGRLPVGSDGTVVISVDLPNKGDYDLTVTFEGNENYTSDTTEINDITIEGSTSELVAEIVNSTQGNVTIKVDLVDPVTGDELSLTAVNVTLPDGTTQEYPVNEDGTIIVPLDVGENDIVISYPGDDTYNATEIPVKVNVEPRESSIEAEVTNTTAGNITVKVNITDATTGEPITSGTVDITLNGEVVGTVDLSEAEFEDDGTVIISTNIDNIGNYALVAKYSGDENYTANNYNIESFDATPKESNIIIDIPNLTKGNTTLDVSFTDPVTGEPLNGTVYVIINGEEPGKPVKIVDGVPETELLLDLPVGVNTVKVEFDGDKKYDSTSDEITIKVEPRKINVNATLTNTTQGNITLEVNVTDDETGAGVNGTVNVTLPNGTEVTVEIVDGKGVIVLDIPIDDSTDEPLVVTYPADGVNNQTTVKTTNALTINTRSSKVEAEVTNPVADKTEVTVTVTDPVTGLPVTSGNVSVKLGDEEIGRLPVGEDGTVVVPVDLPNKDTYTLTVTFEGNQNYTGDTTELSDVIIEGSESEVVAEITNATQGNVTIKVDIVDPVTGDPIPVDAVNVTLADGTTKEYSINEDGTITVPLDVGENSITISYPGDDTYNETSIPISVTVEPRAMNIEAEVTNTTAGNITVKVNVTDAVTGKPVTSGKVNITLGGEVVGEADIREDGTAIVYTNINKTGKYTLTANVGGNENYTDNYENIESFDSKPKESSITATVPKAVKDNTTVNVTFVDPVTGDKLNGTVYVSVNGSKPVPVKVINGNGEIPLDLPVGDSTIKVTFDGDEKYNETEYEFDVTVAPRAIEVGYELTNKTQGNVTIKVTVNDTETGEGINGTVIVDVDGTPVEVEIVDGEGTAVLDIPITGGNITVSYPADDTYEEVPATEKESVEVVQRESSITAEPASTSANDTSVKVTLRDPVTDDPITSGTIVVTDNGVEVARIEFNEETGEVIVPTNITTSGKHNLTVTFEGNENYTSSSYADDTLAQIDIANRTANITVTPNNSTVGNTTIDVTVVDSITGEPLPAGGTVKVYDENGTEVGTGTIGEDGTVTVPIDVPVDTTKVTVRYMGNDTSYDPAEVPYEDFKLDPRTSNVVAEVTNTTAGNITVKVNVTDATTGKGVTSGTVNITLNGKVVGTANIPEDLEEDGTVLITTNLNETGNYKLVAKYSGDENYTGETYTMESFDAEPKESTVTASIPNTTKGNTTIEIDVVDPVTGEKLNGTVLVTLPNGTNVPVKVEDGKGSLLLDLPVGNNTLTVKYPSNNKYDEDTFEFNVTVEPRKINVNASLTNTTQGNITLEVNVTDDETGEGINGTIEVELPNGTKVPVEVVDGKASVILDIPVNDTGKPVTVTFPTDGVNNETTITTEPISIQTRDSEVEAVVSEPVANKTEVTVTVRDPVTGKPVTSGDVSVKLGDKEIGRLPVGEDGKVTIPVELTDKGDYNLTVTFEGNENYTKDTTVLSDVTIEGSESEVVAEITNATQGNVTIKVDIVDPVTGETIPVDAVNVTLADGTTKEYPINDDGTITVPLDVGDNNITISYPGSDTYNQTSIPVNVKVEPREAVIEAEVTNNTAGNTTVNVKVTDPVTGKPVTSGEVSVTSNGVEVGRLPVGPDGTVTIPTNITSTGSYPLIVTYNGNDNYDSASEQVPSVTVLPKESQIKAELTNNTRGNTSISIDLVDPVTGEGLNGKVTVTLPDGTNMPVDVTKGKAVIPVDLPTGNSTLKVTYLGNNTYDSIHQEIPVSVEKRETTVTSEVLNDTAGSVTIKANVKDTTTGKAIPGGKVVAMVNNKVVGTAIVDEEGNAVIPTNITKSGDYDVVLKYEGDNDYESSNITEDDLNVEPRTSNVTVEVANDTVGDTKVNITMVDPATNTPIDGEVIVTLPNGTNITAKAENGNIVLPVELPAGDNEITVTYPGNDTYDDITVKVPLKVNKRSANTEVRELNSDAGNVELEVKVTDEETGKPVTGGEVTVYSDGKAVGKAQVKDGVAIIDAQIPKAGNYKLDIKYAGTPEYEPEETTHTQKVTPREVNVDVKILNSTVADTKIQVNVTDKTTGKAVPNENVTVTLPNGTKVTVTTDKNGLAILDTELLSGNNSLQVTLNGGDVYNTSTTNITANTEKAKVKVTVDSVEGIIGEKIILTAHVTDEYGNLVNGGNLVFKLNGRSLRTDLRFDTNNTSVYKLSVKNGIVTIELTADLYLRAGKNITASYSGSYKYEAAKGNVAEANIRKRTAEVTVSTSPKLVKQDKDIVFTAKITDVTTGSNKSLVNDNAYVLFKVNGKTLKDSNGENIKVKVTNGVAKYTYHVPLGTSGMTDGHLRDYIVTAVYAGENYYPDSRDSVAYNVERSSTKIKIINATVKNDKLSVKANILDQYGNNVIGTNKIAIKVNGKTFKVNGKSYSGSAKDGVINISGLKLNGNKVKSLTIVTGERQSYYESSVTTTSVKTL